METCNKSDVVVLNIHCFHTKASGTAKQVSFPKFVDFAVWWLHSVAYPYVFGMCYSYFLHFLRYRSIPRIGFSADISIDVL